MEVMEPFFMYCHDFQWKKSKNLLMSLNKEDQKVSKALIQFRLERECMFKKKLHFAMDQALNNVS